MRKQCPKCFYVIATATCLCVAAESVPTRHVPLYIQQHTQHRDDAPARLRQDPLVAATASAAATKVRTAPFIIRSAPPWDYDRPVT
jgi:hypothetical protein